MLLQFLGQISHIMWNIKNKTLNLISDFFIDKLSDIKQTDFTSNIKQIYSIPPEIIRKK